MLPERKPLLTRQPLAAALLLSASLHAALLSVLGPVRAPARSSELVRLEARIKDAPQPVATVVADPAPLVETVADSPLSAPPELAEAESQVRADLPDAESRLALPIDEHFFKSSELDEQPTPLVTVVPAYPPHAQARDVEGWVRLVLLIDENGQLLHLKVIEASPPGVFDEAALEAFRTTPFSPGRRGTKAVKSRMLIKVDFTLPEMSGPRRE
ncbi:TonB family protein [Candidatus Accumulibacter aalborgensis]|uniref:Protein TonB n=1 Tax=Candidatus Accumulibacter aalborgensis TaxID=1860102 RepID=A0A1A8XHY0_9PROT|nr:energy transducer TonB [Candidatus Accumulibacter aalborgensis]SBT04301.1 TonB family protein [Candidatus Accumulibacter aalborgensis]